MKKRFYLAFAVAALLGTAQHFLYDLFPNPLTAIFAPVNESVWEHLKLLFYPTLLAGLFLSWHAPLRQRVWGAILLAALAQPLFLLALYYPLRAGFGVESVAVDILLYYAAMAFGGVLAERLCRSGISHRLAGIATMLAGLYAVCLLLFTFAAPNLPIFLENPGEIQEKALDFFMAA